MRALRRLLRHLLSRSERIRLWYLERDLASLRREYRRAIGEARGSKVDPQELQSRYEPDIRLAEEEIESIRTERILRRARALRVPFPSPRPRGHDFEKGDDNWDLGSMLGQWTLTDEGEARFRQAIRSEEKAQRESAAFWFSVVTGPIAILTALGAVVTVLNATQQKELSRLDHLPAIGCSVAQEGGHDSLIVANAGSRVRGMKVSRITFFVAQPSAGAGKATVVRYVVDDYYADQIGPDYEGNQRMVFGLAKGPGNLLFVTLAAIGLLDSLPRHHLDCSVIEVDRAVRVVYWDWLGTKMEEHFWGSGQADQPPKDMERISRVRWKRLSASADSLRRLGHVLVCAKAIRATDTQRMMLDCMDAVAR